MGKTITEVQKEAGLHNERIYTECFEELHKALKKTLARGTPSINELKEPMMNYAKLIPIYIIQQKQAMAVIHVVSRQFAIKVLRDMQTGWKEGLEIVKNAKISKDRRETLEKCFLLLYCATEGWIQAATRDTIRTCDMLEADSKLKLFAALLHTTFEFPSECWSSH